MDGWKPEDIRSAHPAMFAVASYDDFALWNRQWPFMTRINHRLKFFGAEVWKILARQGGMIP